MYNGDDPYGRLYTSDMTRRMMNQFIKDYSVIDWTVRLDIATDQSEVEVRMPLQQLMRVLSRVYENNDRCTIIHANGKVNRVYYDDWISPKLDETVDEKPEFMTYDQLFEKEEGDERSAKN